MASLIATFAIQLVSIFHKFSEIIVDFLYNIGLLHVPFFAKLSLAIAISTALTNFPLYDDMTKTASKAFQLGSLGAGGIEEGRGRGEREEKGEGEEEGGLVLCANLGSDFKRL